MLAAAVVAATLGVVAGPAGADSQTTSNVPYTCTTNGFGNQNATFGATVSDSVNPAQPGDAVTYRFVIPFAQSPPPVTATYKGGQVFFRIPVGFAVTAVSTQNPPGGSPISSTAAVQGDSVVVTSTANLPIDGNTYPTPDLLVTGMVQPAAAGPGVVWKVPYRLTANVDAQFVGMVNADCTPNDPTVVLKTTTVPLGPQAPVAVNQSVALAQGTSKAITLAATDADDPVGSLTFAIATQPTHGTLTGAAPNVTYTPDPAYKGLDSFTFTARDPGGLVGTGTVSINVFSSTVVDTTPPTVTVSSPTSGAVLAPGQVVAAAFACADATTGIKTCTGSTASGSPIDTSTVGPHTFVVNATDNANNPARVTVSYRVVDPTPVVQSYNATGTPNQIPLDCGGVPLPTTNDFLPAVVSAPPQIGSAGPLTFRVAIGPGSVPALTTATNLVYTFKAPVNGTATAVAFVPGTGSGNVQSSSTVAITGGKAVITIAGPIDGGQTAPTPYTPRAFDVTITPTGAAGAAVQTQFERFQEHDVLGVVPTDKSCTGGNASKNQPNPVLTTTTIIDTTPPLAVVAKPGNGDVYTAGDHVTVVLACADDHALASCNATVPNGAALDTATPGIKTFVLTATDAAGNVAERFVSYTVQSATVTFTARFASSQAGQLYTTAVKLKTTPDQLPRIGVALLRFIVALSGTTPNPIVPPPPNQGPIVLTTTYPRAEVPPILTLATQFGLDGDQLHNLGTNLLIYLVALGG